MQVKGTEWRFGLSFKSKEKKRKNKRYEARQRVYSTKKEGTFSSLLPNKLILSPFRISRLSELKNLGPSNRIENFRKSVRQWRI